jgi:hypothetical protein
VKSLLHTWLRNGRQQFQEAFLFDFLVKSFLHIGSELVDKEIKSPSSLINLCIPFFMVHLQLVEKEIKRPSYLILLRSPFFIFGLELVDKEIKRPSSLFSCGVLTSHLVSNWSTTIS